MYGSMLANCRRMRSSLQFEDKQVLERSMYVIFAWLSVVLPYKGKAFLFRYVVYDNFFGWS